MKRSTKKRILTLLTALTMLAALVIHGPVKAKAKNVSDYYVFWKNVNYYSSVSNGPTKATKFTISKGKKITLDAISLYHYNHGSGKIPGKITLEKGNTKIGAWKAKGRNNNQWWDVFPNIILSAGTYTITCSSNNTWSYNSDSNNAGFAVVYGTHPGSDSLGKPTIKSVKRKENHQGYPVYRIKWKKVPGASYYMIQTSKYKDFSSPSECLEEKTYVSLVFSKEKNVRYYSRVRAYKKSGSKYIYSKWSATKSYVVKR